MKSIVSYARIATLVLLALAFMSCGNATTYDGPPGTTGALSSSPGAFTLTLAFTGLAPSLNWEYAGGLVIYFVATGGTPPYYWYQSVPSVGTIEPVEGDDNMDRRLKYTTNPISGSGGTSVTDVITVVDQTGASTTSSVTLTITAAPAAS